MNQSELTSQIAIGERWRRFLDAVGFDSIKLNPWQLYTLGGIVLKHRAVQEAATATAMAQSFTTMDSLAAARNLQAETKAAIRTQLQTALALQPRARF